MPSKCRVSGRVGHLRLGGQEAIAPQSITREGNLGYCGTPSSSRKFLWSRISNLVYDDFYSKGIVRHAP